MVPPPPRALDPAVGRRPDPGHDARLDALSADLRARGFRFVGSTIVYAFMQSVGLVDDHVAGLLPVPRRRPDRRRFVPRRTVVTR